MVYGGGVSSKLERMETQFKEQLERTGDKLKRVKSMKLAMNTTTDPHVLTAVASLFEPTSVSKRQDGTQVVHGVRLSSAGKDILNMETEEFNKRFNMKPKTKKQRAGQDWVVKPESFDDEAAEDDDDDDDDDDVEEGGKELTFKPLKDAMVASLMYPRKRGQKRPKESKTKTKPAVASSEYAEFLQTEEGKLATNAFLATLPVPAGAKCI